MSKPTLDLEHLIDPHSLACGIAMKYNDWSMFRNNWIEEKKELRNYIFATDTRTTTNKRLPWSNSTTTPKLTQIYDNLKANYSAALFPNTDWMRWEGEGREDSTKAKRDIIQAYMSNKVRNSGFEEEADKLIDDFVLYGNCFGQVSFENEYHELEDGTVVPGYIGPKLTRISPYDIVFDPTASSFYHTPKIVRSIVGVGELVRDTDYKKSTFQKMTSNRKEVNVGASLEKQDAYIADGFSSIEHYYGSDYVELLTFYGDIYDSASETVRTNRMITVVDRAYVWEDVAIPSWLGREAIFHSGWRSRPDNLMAMGPLDNLVGLQYRIDHLENLKADVFDQIALPMVKIKGDVEDFTFQPGERIYLGDEGDVGYLSPDATALNADFQIQNLENKMEELAGAPRQAMGIRTPGEKTAFEVQTLQNSAGRIFQHKATKFEREFLEPVLNAMLEASVRNMKTADVIRVFDDELGITLFPAITKEDITAKGKIIPRGASHFAERAQRVQNITQLLQLKQDPTIGVHLSGKKIAELIAEELGEKDLYGDNIAVEEQLETQKASSDAEADFEEGQMIAMEEGL